MEMGIPIAKENEHFRDGGKIALKANAEIGVVSTLAIFNKKDYLGK